MFFCRNLYRTYESTSILLRPSLNLVETMMSSAKLSEVMAAMEHETLCPVCLEDFQEPKCLPNCAHNVCQNCLEGMTGKNVKLVECPVCRVESTIPRAGVSAFPKNHLLARLIEKTPSSRSKKRDFVKEVVKRSKENVEGLKDVLHEMETRHDLAVRQAESLKQEISTAAENIRETVHKLETKLLLEVDQYMEKYFSGTIFDKHRRKLTNLLAKASSCAESIETCVPKRKGGEKRFLKLLQNLEELSKVAGVQIISARRKCVPMFGLCYSGCEISEKSVEDILGSLRTEDRIGTEDRNRDDNTSTAFSAGRRPIDENVVKRIDGKEISVPNFLPFALSVSRKTGEVAVLDAENKRVHIFDRNGHHLTQFLFIFGDFWDITYSQNDEIVILNRENNCLLHYDRSGSLKKKFPMARNPEVKFTFLSSNPAGRLLVTSSPRYKETVEDTKACVLVYSPSGKLELTFGEGRLSSPKKAVWLSDQYFVPDADSKSVKVFGGEGEFLREIGDEIHDDLAGITVDHTNSHVLVCDCEGYAVHVYDEQGQLVRIAKTEAPPVEIALSKDGTNLLVCFDGEKAKCLQILTYNERAISGNFLSTALGPIPAEA